MQNLETLEKKFVKIDEENFSQIEIRKATTPINYKKLFVEMGAFAKNLVQDCIGIINSDKQIEASIKAFNDALDDCIQAKEELGYDFEVPEKLTKEGLFNLAQEQLNGGNGQERSS